MAKELRNNTFHILLSYFKRGILARVYFLMAWTVQCACAVGVGHTSEYWEYLSSTLTFTTMACSILSLCTEKELMCIRVLITELL